MDELLKAYESRIEFISLIPSDGGRFEITVNNQLVYSKLQTGRHMEEGEATQVVKDFLEK
jgi:selenoprotein W-related protein